MSVEAFVIIGFVVVVIGILAYRKKNAKKDSAVTPRPNLPKDYPSGKQK